MAVNGWWASLARLTVTVQWECVGKCFYFSSAMFRFPHFRTVCPQILGLGVSLGVFTLDAGVMTKRSDWRFWPSTKQKKKQNLCNDTRVGNFAVGVCVWGCQRCIRSDSALLYVGVWILPAGWSTLMERWRSLLYQVSAVTLLLSCGFR